MKSNVFKSTKISVTKVIKSKHIRIHFYKTILNNNRNTSVIIRKLRSLNTQQLALEYAEKKDRCSLLYENAIWGRP